MPPEALFKWDAKNSLSALFAHLPLGLDNSSQLFSWDMWAVGGLSLTYRARLSAHLDNQLRLHIVYMCIFFFLFFF